MIKSKADLKALFRKNSVPSEADFADLIESGLNQSDDGIRKGPGDPLSVVAGGETQELFSFYNSADAKQPGWKINQNPSGGNAGFNIYNDAKGSCLFIDENTGKIGIGSQTPNVKLTVSGAIHVGMENDKDLFKKGQGLYLNWNYSGNDGETNLINHKGGGEGGFSFQNTDGGTLSEPLLYIRGNGNVGIGVGLEASCKLDVRGDIKASGSITSKGITLTDSGAIKLIDSENIQLDTTNLGLYSTIKNRYMQLVTNDGPIIFCTEPLHADGTVSAEAMVIKPNGNIGIGTRDRADERLHISGKAKIEGDVQATGSLTSRGITLTDKGSIRLVDEKNIPVDTHDMGLYSTIPGRYMRLVSNKAPILFFTEELGAEGSGVNVAMAIRPDGRVGIGTAGDAHAKLHVNGAIKIGVDANPEYYNTGEGAYIGWNGKTCFFNNRRDRESGFLFGAAQNGESPYILLSMHSSGIVSVGDDPNANARLDVKGNLRVSGDRDPGQSYNDYKKSQGAYITWNERNGYGETTFINNFGGAPNYHGGFIFYDLGPNDPKEQLALLTRQGGLEVESLKVSGKSVTGSDARIKKDISTSDGINNLKILNKLNIAEYRYIDPKNFGDTLRKGLIAQEVEAVYPEAVVTKKEFLPNILAKPQEVLHVNGKTTFVMDTPHHLANGDVVKMKSLSGNLSKTVIAADDTSFSVEGAVDEFEGEVFIYGKQVEDFKMIEYDRLYLLNLSATQQLAKQNEELRAKITDLENELGGFGQRLSSMQQLVN